MVNINQYSSLLALFEAQTDPNLTDEGTTSEETPNVAEERKLAENPELESLKKFLLIQKLQTLNMKMNQHDIMNTSLSTFLDFANSMSYDTIVTMATGFTDFILQNLNGEPREQDEESGDVEDDDKVEDIEDVNIKK